MTSRQLTALLVLGLLSPPTFAQPQLPGAAQPRLLVVQPAGGQAGSTVEVTLTGQDLDEPQGLLFSAPGIKAEAVPEPAADPKKKPAPRQPNAPMTVRFKVSIPPDAPLGAHDIRFVGKLGVSNPRAFVVGDLPESVEKEPNNDVDQAQRVELNSTVHGTINAPVDVDYFVFTGRKGQRVVVSCLASSIDSRLPAALELYGKAGALLASNRDYHGSDALLDCTLPEDGDYHVRVFSFTYTQGGPEHFYRLTISTAPWIDAVFPPVVEPGKKTTVTVFGRNLPGGTPDPAAVGADGPLERLSITVEPPGDPAALQALRYSGLVPPRASGLDGFELRLRNEVGTSNPFLLTYATAPVVLEREANDTPATAQEVAVPCEIAGRIDRKHDQDWYRFRAKKGDVYSLEFFGDRIGSPLDLYVTLRPAGGKSLIAELDDDTQTLSPNFLTRSEDPARYRFTPTADGDYLLQVTSRDADVQAGPRHVYRVRIAPERPDFRLIVLPPAPNVPDAVVLRQGGRAYYTVLVWRQDGFTGDIALSADGLPEGVTCPPQVVGTNQRQATLVLSAAADAPLWAGTIRVQGVATVRGERLVREARPATVTWPVPAPNLPAVCRLDRSLALAVRDKAPFSLTAGIDQSTVQPGEKVTVPLKLARLAPDFKANVLLVALNLPQPGQIVFNNNQPLPLSKDEMSVVLDVRPNAPPGTYTILFRGQAVLPNMAPAVGQRRGGVALVQPATPVTITVVPQLLATPTLAPGTVTVMPGKEAPVTVRIKRLNAYRGPCRVQLVVPPEVKGIEADEVTIPEGKDEAPLVLRAAADAAPGPRPGLAVRVIVLWDGKVPVRQESKLAVMVSK